MSAATKKKHKHTTSIILSIVITLLILASAVLVWLGSQGVGSESKPMEVPDIDKPFDADSPNELNEDVEQTVPQDMVPNEVRQHDNDASDSRVLQGQQTSTPNQLAIPSLDIRATIQATGINSATNEMVIPKTPLVGIYDSGAPLTSDQGSSLLMGHVNYDSGALAPISNIAHAKKGALVYATDDDGVLSVFAIDTAQKYTQGKLPDAFFSANEGEHQLVLVTCTDMQYANGSLVFTNNITVTAKPVTESTAQ